MNPYPLLRHMIIAIRVKATIVQYPVTRDGATDIVSRDGVCFDCSVCPFSGAGTHYVCAITGIFTPPSIEIDRNTPWKRQLRLRILTSLGIRS